MTFPHEAMQFYAELRLDNSREFWQEHKPRYLAEVREPLAEVAALLSDEFGEAKLYRPNRDVRFSPDKSPYKTHQGAFVSTGPACGWYTEVNADEMSAGGGFYYAEGPALTRFRKAIDDPRGGARLQAILDELIADGWIVMGDLLATAPRGYPRDHERIELLRHKWLYVVNEVDPGLSGPAAVADEVARLWRATRPLVEWLTPLLKG